MLSQADTPDCVWTQFEHANGTLASEGCMVDGVPAGVWKSYSDLGELISEGARENNLPEGRWWFYDQGQLREEVHYHQGVKHGIQVLHQDGVLTDSVVWVQGQKEGDAKSFRPDGTLKLITPHQQNVREGKAIQFNLREEPHGFRWYKNDRLVASEVFNRRDDEGLRTGEWKVFHASGRVLESGPYRRDKRHGLFQFFDARGTLVRVERYNMGELVLDETKEEAQPELREVRRSDGSLESTTMYIQGVKQGVSRTFNDQGEVVAGAIFDQDELVAEGITLKDGTKEGPWREFWPNGQIRAEGIYESGVREGKWTFYRITGEKEQEGKYREGAFHGTWTWWYPGGQIHREEDYTLGKLDGEFLELDTAGGVLVKGTFVDGDPGDLGFETSTTIWKKVNTSQAKKTVSGASPTRRTWFDLKGRTPLASPRENTGRGTPTGCSRRWANTKVGPSTASGVFTTTKATCCTNTFTTTENSARWTGPKWTSAVTEHAEHGNEDARHAIVGSLP